MKSNASAPKAKWIIASPDRGPDDIRERVNPDPVAYRAQILADPWPRETHDPKLKEQLWLLLSQQNPLRWATPKRLARLKDALWYDREFWSDIVDRHLGTPRVLQVRGATPDDDRVWEWTIRDKGGYCRTLADAVNDLLCSLDPHLREHLIGNFWGMLAQTAHQLGFKV